MSRRNNKVSSFKFQVSSFKFDEFVSSVRVAGCGLQVTSVLVCLFFFSCQRNYTPKPHSYYRIDFPEKEYQRYDSLCPFTFEYPVYGRLVPDKRPTSGACWFNIEFPKYKGTIYLSYHEIDGNFDQLIEDNWKMIYTKIAQKADAVDDGMMYSNPGLKVYGTIYDIKGNAASSAMFWATDSVQHFLRGSLYFWAQPNYDSLAPAITFFRQDIIHLMESIEWKK